MLNEREVTALTYYAMMTMACWSNPPKETSLTLVPPGRRAELTFLYPLK